MDIDIWQLPIPDWGLVCPICRYPLLGLPSHRCPECGTDLDMNQLVKTHHCLRAPEFTGYELPVPDWGLDCSGCNEPLAGWPSRDCPMCGRTFEPWPEPLAPEQWFTVDHHFAKEIPLAMVEVIFVEERIPYMQQHGKVLREIVAGPPVLGTGLRVPREFYYDVLAVLQSARRNMADVRSRRGHGHWACPNCGERVPGHFEICWKCETERP